MFIVQIAPFKFNISLLHALKHKKKKTFFTAKMKLTKLDRNIYSMATTINWKSGLQYSFIYFLLCSFLRFSVFFVKSFTLLLCTRNQFIVFMIPLVFIHNYEMEKFQKNGKLRFYLFEREREHYRTLFAFFYRREIISKNIRPIG